MADENESGQENVVPHEDEGKNEPTVQSHSRPTSTTPEGENGGQPSGLPQDKVNEIVGKARQEGREKALKDLFSELGVDSAKSLKSIIEEREEARRAEMSEMERLQDERQKLEERLQEAEQISNMAKKETEKALVRAEVARLASSKFQDVDVVLRMLEPDAVEIDLDDGSVKGLESALEQMEEKYPWMLIPQNQRRPSATNPTRGDRPSGRTDDDRRRDYFQKQNNTFWEGGGVRVIKED